jgi:hypothetical protein
VIGDARQLPHLDAEIKNVPRYTSRAVAVPMRLFLSYGGSVAASLSDLGLGAAGGWGLGRSLRW